MLENPHLNNTVQLLRAGNGSINKADVTENFLDKLHEREIEQSAKSQQSKIVSLSLDGWSNVHNEPLAYACVTTEDGNVFLIERTDN